MITHPRFSLACLAALWLGYLVVGARGAAQDKPAVTAAPAAAVKKEAKERFDRGISLFNEGDNAGALSEFKRAYELIPNQLVLFNIGLTYAGMKRPVDAVDTLDAVLAAPQGLNPSQIELATRTREDQIRRIGSVVVVTNVPATISIDGVEVQRTAADQPLRVAQGTHVIGAAAPDRIARTHEITIAGSEQQRVELELALTDTASAQVVVTSPLRDVEISVDGKPAGKTPFEASITVEPGRHSIAASRAGYASETRDLQLAQGGTGKLDFALREDPTAASSYGVLQLQLSEPLVDVFIDQSPRGRYTQPLSLPLGPHQLRVERSGFVPAERAINVTAGQTTTVALQLAATAGTIAAKRDAASTQRTWGWVGIIGGAALAAGGVTLAVIEQGQWKNARDDYRDISLLFEKNSGRECDMFAVGKPVFDANRCGQRLQAAQGNVASHSTLRNVGLAVAGVGTAAAITGIIVLLAAADADKYDTSPALQGGASRLWLAAAPDRVWLLGSF